MAGMACLEYGSRIAGEISMRIFFQIAPIVAALRSHKAAVILLVLEITLTMAVLSNLAFIVYGAVQRAYTPTGAAEGQIGVIQSIGVIGKNNPGTAAGNLLALRNVPGVADAAYGGLPLWQPEREPIFLDSSRKQSRAHAYEFQGSQGLSRTLGVQVVKGHNFSKDAIPVAAKVTDSTEFPVLITRALAAHLFPGGNALGQVIYGSETNPMRVIGIVNHLRGEITGRADDDYAIIAEFLLGSQNLGGGYLIRADNPTNLPTILQTAALALQRANPGHVQDKVFTMSELREKYFHGDLATNRMLITIMLILLAVTALGVSGLASFWVHQRRRQIGMRRALGATRGDVLSYFLTENFLIVSGGVLLGAICAYALNLFLMHHFELPRLPPFYLIVGAIVLWLLGQLAVLGPALRASHMPPVAATRAI